MIKTTNERVLVLGASSWLGYLMIQQLSSKGVICAGSINLNDVFLGEGVLKYKIFDLETLQNALKDFEPAIIVNFLRGEDDNGLTLHKEVINYSNENKGYYMFASSILALDGYVNTPLEESLIAKSISEYGKFKANCEHLLLESSIDYSIIRFASVQGWVAHKFTRNERFLNNLYLGKPVIVNRGVRQNRMSANLLVLGITMLLQNRIKGTIHFGTTNDSDEVEFLREQAQIFGYNKNLVQEDGVRKVNLVAIPNKIYSVMGESYKSSEQDTLAELLKFEGLRKYINKLYECSNQ